MAKVKKHYKKTLNVLKTRLKIAYSLFIIRFFRRKIRIAFIVIFDSVFPLERVFQLALEDKAFDPYIVVAPDISRGETWAQKLLTATYENLSRKYGDRCISSMINGQIVDLKDKFDLCAMANPYDTMTHRYYTIKYLASHGMPLITSRYFTETGTVYSNVFNSTTEFHYLWRFYAENDTDARTLKKVQKLLAVFKGIKAVGSPKMDCLSFYKELPRKRKRIIIAPHHSMDPIGAEKFTISNFPQYSDFFLSLPKRYPEIDWVFRPHPLTFKTMVLSGRWTDKQHDEYIEELIHFTNVEYQKDGDYLETFLNSDGMIQDCSSFLPEYFYTDNPQCYLLRNESAENEQFEPYGRELLSHTYKAFCEADIHNFIQNVVQKNQDDKKTARLQFAKECIIYNFPHASESILHDLKQSLRKA